MSDQFGAIGEGLRAMLASHPGRAERVAETGTLGGGGDRTLVIDAAAEEIVFAELARLHDDGARFVAISEERGEVDFGGGDIRVVVDPIDGSLNAKRGLSHHAVSIAVASGPTIADVEFGFVYDFGPGEEWWARRGGGAWCNGVVLDRELAERRDRNGKIEIVGIEASEPELIAASIGRLVGRAYRIRALGTIAVALCQVAGGRFDGAVTLRPCRAVDAAAGVLIVREGGGVVSCAGTFGVGRSDGGVGGSDGGVGGSDDGVGGSDGGVGGALAFPLELSARSPIVAARSAETLRELEQVVAP